MFHFILLIVGNIETQIYLRFTLDHYRPQCSTEGVYIYL